MKHSAPSLEWLQDVQVFKVNRLEAHSDHRYYEEMASAEAGAPMAMRHSLNGRWQFNYAVNPASRVQSFYQMDYNCSAWEHIQVPGHIQLQGWGQPQYVNTMYPWDGVEALRPPHISQEHNPVGSYVKNFELPATMVGKPVYISFQGVESAFYVWLNGEFIGYSEDSFTPAEFDLTPHIREGENKLAVEVYQRSTGSWLEDQDFWRMSGIFREVYLYTVPKVHVWDMRVKADLDDAYEQGLLEIELKLRNEQASSVRAKLELKDAEGLVILSEEGEFSQDNLRFNLAAGHVQPWSAESPYLYAACISIYDESGHVVEAIVQKVGFRRFEMKDKLMCINGKRIVFKGVNRHEFNSRSGRAITKQDMLWDIQTLKRSNINSVRTSHYPNQTLWYELCDEYGVYVIDEMNLETHGSWQKMGAIEPSWNIPGNDMQWQDIVMDRAISMVERDKNHPSILIWSCGNESYAGQVILNVSNYFRETDPTRLVHYEGVFYDRINYGATSDMESRMYAKPADIEAYLNNQPDKPYLSCEYMHAMGNSVGGLHKYTELENKYPMYQGGFIWDYIDQAIVKKDRNGREFLAYGGDFKDRPTDYSFCGNGLVFADRQITPKMQEVKFLYQNIKLEPTRTHINIVNENLFANTDDLVLVYRLYHEGIEIGAGQANIEVEAQSEFSLPIELPNVDGTPGEYCIQASLVLREATLWADAGFETSFGETTFVVGASRLHEQPSGEVIVVEGDVNMSVTGKGFIAIFSKQVGSLVSLQYEGREMIATPPAPLFWRATTDNDKGTAMSFTAGAWYAASLARKCVKWEIRQEQGSATVIFDYKFSIHSDVSVRIAYTVLANGTIRVNTQYKGAAGLPNLPILAVSFKMSADYSQSEWYAMGPEENYIDRNFGARLGVFSRPVNQLPTPYLVPQESGNRTGVRRVNVTDVTGIGLSIQSDPLAPVECNLSPYTAFELEHADHAFELPEVHYTVVTVAGKQMGVGGDDSWGAPVHEEYQIPADQEIQFEFFLSSHNVPS
ncbi:glycoside hydrolase family 2 TIM barrel-domain containing protein [Paenibacillus qinlingensis]|uniref:Beta-galactosidase n=1 Tax=Paenibacillus qinlingensis TaxID=1837343 RepID=A0ABU1P4Q5_9BACL|nr:glycoside hydrolase family 2 TIM barrel-domain containing protein [Paenibacillus qinlingensis]MDR6554724.1 beta-galactosidase [Paenibacillus qinlingensis]